MAYIKPQYPLKNGDNYLYPVTTHDQILLDDGSRWDGDVGVKSVNSKTGAVTLSASDVGALKDDGSSLHTFSATTGTGNYWGLEQAVTSIVDTHPAIGIRFFGENAQRVSRAADGSYLGYKIYDEGNKPTASDVGAAAASHTHNYVTNSASTWDGNTNPVDIPSGISYVEVSSTGTDAGFPVSYGVCLSIKISTNRLMQILVNKSNDTLYTRAANGNTAWYNWNKLVSAADFSLSGTTLTITTT